MKFKPLIQIFFIFLSCIFNAHSKCIPLIIVHPSQAFDDYKSAKKGIDDLVRSSECPDKIYLLHTNRDLGYLKDTDKLKKLVSQDGEHKILIEDDDVRLAGGYDDACMNMALGNIIWERDRAKIRKSLTVHLTPNAIFSIGQILEESFNGNLEDRLSCEGADPYFNRMFSTLKNKYSEFYKCISIVTKEGKILRSGQVPCTTELQLKYN